MNSKSRRIILLAGLTLSTIIGAESAFAVFSVVPGTVEVVFYASTQTVAPVDTNPIPVSIEVGAGECTADPNFGLLFGITHSGYGVWIDFLHGRCQPPGSFSEIGYVPSEVLSNSVYPEAQEICATGTAGDTTAVVLEFHLYGEGEPYPFISTESRVAYKVYCQP